MVQRLKSYFGNPIALKSFISALAGTVAVAIYAMGTATFFFAVLVVLIAAYIYSKLLDRRTIRWSFWMIVCSYVVGIAFADDFLPFLSPGIVWVGIVLSFFFIFFGVVGSGNFLFEDRRGMYGVVHTAVLFVVFLVFGGLSMTDSWIWNIPLFFGSVVIMKEFMKFMKIPFPGRILSFAVVSGLFFVELFVVLGFLPLGPIHTAIFVALFAFTLKNLGILHFSGTLSKKMFLREISIFIIGVLILFAASRWTI